MTRLRLFRRRTPVDPELEQAKRHTAASRARAQREYRTSVSRLADSQAVAQQLHRHNAANRYVDWLESSIRGTR